MNAPNKHLLIAKRVQSVNGNSIIRLTDGRFNQHKRANWSDFANRIDQHADSRRIGAMFAESLGYTVEFVAEIDKAQDAIIVAEFVALKDATPEACKNWRKEYGSESVGA